LPEQKEDAPSFRSAGRALVSGLMRRRNDAVVSNAQRSSSR